MKNRTICIIYGLNEGPAMGRGFVRACKEAGLTITKNPASADIVFAHANGCFLIPPWNQAQHIVLVGLPYWPGRPWIVSTFRKVWQEAGAYYRQHTLATWPLKWTLHVRYSLDTKAAMQMGLNQHVNRPWNSPQPQTIIRNRYDAYCSPDVMEMDFKGPRAYISLPGEHDDCWDHPERYISLLQSL